MQSLLSEIDETTLLTRVGNTVWREDPMPVLLREKWARPVGRGLFVLSGPLIPLLRRLENTLRSIAEATGALEIRVPSILSPENARASCYAESFNNQALFAYKASPGQPAVGMLSPTVCYHYFSALQSQTLQKPEIVHAIASCARNEEGELNSLQRLTNFSLYEITGYGTHAECEFGIENIKKHTLSLLNESFDLDYQITIASDPFFCSSSELMKKAQLANGAKQEIRATLPFSSKALAIASINRHGKVFFDRFGIKSGAQEKMESFCVGFGLERLLYVVLAQKGLDFSSRYYQSL